MSRKGPVGSKGGVGSGRGAPSEPRAAPSRGAAGPGPEGWVLVTGAAVRVGREMLLAFAQAGHDVVLHHHTSERQARQVTAEARDLGVQVLPVQADLATARGREHLVGSIERTDRPLVHAVLSASIFHATPFDEVKEEQWDRLFDVNLKAPFFTAQALAPLVAEGGSLIFIGDVGAESPWPSYVPYGATKAGIHAVTRGLAKALAPRVRVNAVAPGAVLAPKTYGPDEMQRAIERVPLGRWGDPKDVAAAVLYLAGAPYVTGVILPVDGGRSIA